MVLKYTGARQGREDLSVAGIPAHNLSDEEVSEYGGEALILATGLYEKAGEKASKKVTQNKAQKGAKENK